MILVWVVMMSFLTLKPSGVPIARFLECGMTNRQINIEKQSHCCTYFRLNCNASDTVEYISSQHGKTTSDNQDSKFPSASHKLHRRSGSESKKILLRVRTLGQSCHSKYVRCATGLTCRRGLCLRSRTTAHFQQLIRLGEKIEQEERADQGDGPNMPDRNNDDVDVPSAEGITLQGQSLGIRLDKSSYNVDLNMDKTISRGSPQKTRSEIIDDKAASGIEEDEVTANVADFLESKGIKLDSGVWHNVREIIAGTLDERIERGQEVERADVALEMRDSGGCTDKSRPCNMLNQFPSDGLCPALP